MDAIPEIPPPFLVALNLTRRCNLDCGHCYLDAGTRNDGQDGELKTGEVKTVLDDIAAMGNETMVVLTGGEPLLRRDIYEIAAYADSLSLMTVVGTNGTMLDEKRVLRLKDAGVKGVGISLDSLDPNYHDRFRHLPGSWKRTMSGIDACRRHDMCFQIHFSVTDDNADELEDMISFARQAGALVFNVFFLVCTGRGEKMSANISLSVYEDVLRRVVLAARDEQGMIIRAKCAPHFKRMALQFDPSWPVTVQHGYEAGGCLAGTRYCRVTPEGEVTACPYMETSVGNVRDVGISKLWRDAPLFEQLRSPDLEGRCGDCEYAKLCGGCRARPLARSGNLMGEDFLCGYQPEGGAVIEPMQSVHSSMQWTDEAKSLLRRMPPFVRRFVRLRAEDHVRDKGGDMVTSEIMSELARRRFGDAMKAMRPKGLAQGCSK